MTSFSRRPRQFLSVTVFVAGMLLAGCAQTGPEARGSAAAPSPSGSGQSHSNRIHTGHEAKPSYWVRSPRDHFALFVEETGTAADPGGTRRRALVKAYTPEPDGEGKVGQVLWRDTDEYASYTDFPLFTWEDDQERVWIIAAGGTPGRAAAVRVVAAGADGTWTARTLDRTEYPTIPAVVLNLIPASSREFLKS